MIKFRDNKVLVVGDTHSYRWFERILDKLPNHTDVIHIGDIGVGFFKNREDDIDWLVSLGKKASAKGCRVYALRGNHDDPAFWGADYDDLYLVPDYVCAEFPNGKRALLVGGGISIDRFYRGPKKNGSVDYWVDEPTTQPPEDLAKFDFVFAHDCPDYINKDTASLATSGWAPLTVADKDLMKDALAQRETLNKVAELAEPRCWVYGHFHNDLIMETQKAWGYLKTWCVNINKVKTFDSDKETLGEDLR